MSKKLTFVEWEIKQDEACNKSFIICCEKSCTGCEHDSNAINAWNFAQAQEQKEAQAKQAMYDEKYSELHKANVALMDERDILRKENDSLWVENEDLTKKLEKAEEVIRFYGDKENWLFTGMYCNTGKHKITDRMQAINGWHDQHKSIVNSDIENHSDYLMFGGKRARAYLKENV